MHPPRKIHLLQTSELLMQGLKKVCTVNDNRGVSVEVCEEHTCQI